jgi:GNAT superfamily N-acetyltransferase
MGIRKANKNDFKSIKKVLNSQREWMPAVLNYNLEDGLKTDSIFVYEKDSSILGMVRWHPRQDGTSTLHELCTMKGFQGKGIGKILLNLIPGDIQLKTTEDNISAQKFYLSQGFIEKEKIKGKKRDLLLFTKKSPTFCINLSLFLLDREIEDAVLQNLNDDLLKPYWKSKENRVNASGHGYHSSEAMFYLTGGKLKWTPQVGTDDNGDTHWWLKNKTNNEVLDVTRSQYFHLKKIPPYHNGRGKGFQQQSISSLKLIYKTLKSLQETNPNPLIKNSIKNVENNFLKEKNIKKRKL